MNDGASNRSGYVKIAIVLLMAGVYFFSYFQRLAVPGTIFNRLQVDFAASASAIAMLGAIVFYLYAFMQIFAGLMSDRFGPGRVLVVGGTIMAIGAISFPLTHSLWMLYMNRVLMGFAVSFIFISMTKEIDELFDKRHFAMVLSVAVFIGYSGGLAATYPLDKAAQAFGWRNSLLVVGIANGIAVAAVALLLIKTKRLHGGTPSFTWGRLKNILTNRIAAPLVLTYAMVTALYLLVQVAIGKKLLQDCYGLSSAAAAGFTFSMVLVNMGGSALSGFVSRLLKNRRRPLLIFVASLGVLWTVMVLLILYGLLPTGLMPLAYMLAAVSASCSPVFLSLMKESNPADSAGTSIGFINGVCYLGAALVMNATGKVMDAFKADALVTETAIIYPVKAYIVIFTAALAVAGLALISSFLIRESRGQAIYREK